MKRVLALIFALSLALPFPALAEEASPRTYEEAVAELRNEDMYAIYDTIDTELCTVFLYRRIGTPHIQLPRVDILYKSGAVAKLDLSPEKIWLSEDGKQLICTNSFNPSWGTRVYTVELSSGEIVGEDCILPTQEQLFGWFLGESQSTEERRLEGAEDTVLLFSSNEDAWGRKKEYFLYLICREPARRADPDGWFRRLVLPSTTAVGEKYPQYPTDRAPDEMFLNEDGSVLTYIYRFEDALFNAGGELLHDSGTYTYAVDTATGELSVNHTGKDPAPAGTEAAGFSDVSSGDWFAPYVEICVEEGLMEGVGGGRFDPQGTVTQAQAITLAARVRHILKGGNGKLPAAPENYGILKLTFDNGTVLRFDPTQYRFHPIPMSAVLGADVEGEQLTAMDWLGLEDHALAQAALGDGEPAPCRVYWNSYDGKKGHLRIRARYEEESTEEERAAFHRLEGKLLSPYRSPDWFRSTVYYLESEGLEKGFPLHLSSLTSTDATRADLIGDLNEVAEELLTPINDISDFPDSTLERYSDEVLMKDVILSFYNAGILTGKDPSGAFDPQGTLTRAECAAIMARLMRPELRLRFQLPPVQEKYGYTLTYLMDDPMSGHTTTYPVLPILTGDGENNGFLTLDGDIIPWPGGQKPISIYPMGEYIWCSFWVDGVEQGGLMDKTGAFVLPLQSRFYYAYPSEEGFVASTQLYSGGSQALLDSQGQVVKELGNMSYDDLTALYPHRHLADRIDIHTWGGGFYVDQAKHPVSEGFAWVGALTDDSRGFCGKDGKIYCIQFFEK